jgi:hypothetical protein
VARLAAPPQASTSDLENAIEAKGGFFKAFPYNSYNAGIGSLDLNQVASASAADSEGETISTNSIPATSTISVGGASDEASTSGLWNGFAVMDHVDPSNPQDVAAVKAEYANIVKFLASQNGQIGGIAYPAPPNKYDLQGIVGYGKQLQRDYADAVVDFRNQPVQVNGGSLLEADGEETEQWRESNAGFLDEYRGSFWDDLGANTGTLLSDGGISLVGAVLSVKDVVTDRASLAHVAEGAFALATARPEDLYNSAVLGASRWVDKPLDQEMRDIGDAGMSMLSFGGAEAGGAKALGYVGKVAPKLIEAFDQLRYGGVVSPGYRPSPWVDTHPERLEEVIAGDRITPPNNGLLSVPDTVPDVINPPVPRVDVTDDFIVKTGSDGTVRLQYGNPDGVSGLIVNVDSDGTLGFNIRAPSGGDPVSGASGTDMFASAMQRLDQEGVQVNAIRGTWIEGTDSVNSAEYLSNLDQGMSPQQAAANTWTGRMAARYGFTNVGVPNTGYSTTTVIFGR